MFVGGILAETTDQTIKVSELQAVFIGIYTGPKQFQYSGLLFEIRRGRDGRQASRQGDRQLQRLLLRHI